MKKIILVIAIILVIGLVFLRLESSPIPENLAPAKSGSVVSGAFDQNKLKSDADWKKILTKEQYLILREAGTETPFTGELNNEKRIGTYYSVGCDVPIFRSEQKFDSGTGWPSFWAPIDGASVVLRKESGPGDDRIEVLDICGGHLGHVFDDGPKPTGKRYCMNSIALRFVPDGGGDN